MTIAIKNFILNTATYVVPAFMIYGAICVGNIDFDSLNESDHYVQATCDHPECIMLRKLHNSNDLNIKETLKNRKLEN